VCVFVFFVFVRVFLFFCINVGVCFLCGSKYDYVFVCGFVCVCVSCVFLVYVGVCFI